MSRVGLKVVKRDGSIEHFADAHNASCFAPTVWSYVARRVGLIPADQEFLSCLRYDEVLPKVCRVFNSMQLEPMEDILLGATFDRVWLRRDRLPLFIEALEWFDRMHLPPAYSKTMLEMSKACRSIYEIRPEVLGLAVDQTSVNESWWHQRIPLGSDGQPLTGNGEAVDHDIKEMNLLVHPNCSDGKPHWEIYSLDLSHSP